MKPRLVATSRPAFGSNDLPRADTMSSVGCTANGAFSPNRFAGLPCRLSVNAVLTTDSMPVPAVHRRACCNAGARLLNAPAVKALAPTAAPPTPAPMAAVVN